MLRFLAACLICIFGAAEATAQPDESCDPIAPLVRVCIYDGTASVVAVDRRRVLVALDVREGNEAGDGLVDYYFLYTSEAGIDAAAFSVPFAAHLEYDGNALAVVPSGLDRRYEFVVRAEEHTLTGSAATLVRYGRGIGLSRYVLDEEQPLRLDDLASLEQQACVVPGACYSAAGLAIVFPR